MSPTHTIPHHIANFALEQTSYDALPPDVIAVSKEMMVNAAAAGLAGAAQQDGLIITRFVQEMGGNGKCTIIGKGLRTSPVYAALANGLMIHLLDFDDEVVSSPQPPRKRHISGGDGRGGDERLLRKGGAGRLCPRL